MKITATQTAALARIVAKWDAANAANLARWGVGLNYGISITTGEGDDPVTRNVRTLHVLAEAGLIELDSRSERGADRLIRGNFGRWIGGSVRTSYVAFAAKPTAAGRALLASTVAA
jgi:hypothetical protein